MNTAAWVPSTPLTAGMHTWIPSSMMSLTLPSCNTLLLPSRSMRTHGATSAPVQVARHKQKGCMHDTGCALDSRVMPARAQDTRMSVHARVLCGH